MVFVIVLAIAVITALRCSDGAWDSFHSYRTHSQSQCDY